MRTQENLYSVATAPTAVVARNGSQASGNGVAAEPQHFQFQETLYWLAGSLQRLVGDLLDGNLDTFAAAVTRFARSIPTLWSAGHAKQVDLELMRFALNAGRDFHSVYHGHRPTSSCPFDSDDLALELWLAPPDPTQQSWKDGMRHPGTTLNAWMTSYVERFSAYHSEAIALRAAWRLQKRHADCLDLDTVARELGCKPRTLVRLFARVVGLPLSRYHMRVRIRQVAIELRNPLSKVEVVAQKAGYKSSHNCYQALRTCTGLLPSHVRRLSAMEFERLLDRDLQIDPLKLTQRTCARSGTRPRMKRTRPSDRIGPS